MKPPPKTVHLRPMLARLQVYVPGEQPKVKGLIKLNTNENPYPPSPRVIAATRAAVDARLRLYPEPAGDRLREALARFHRCGRDNIILGNGSDEILAMAVRAFVEPHQKGQPGTREQSRSTLQYFEPSYSLYPVLGQIHGALLNPFPLDDDFGIPELGSKRQGRHWDFNTALTFVTTPNAPSGRGYATRELERLCRKQRGLVLLDEAYVDFAREDAMRLALSLPNVLVARTFSKAYSLCFQRVGYCVGNPALISALHKIRDSYNVNGLGQVAALETLRDRKYYISNFERIKRTRGELARALKQLGFSVFPSESNFLLVRPPVFPASEWLQRLRKQRVLVRWFNQPRVRDFLRITIGTPAEAEALVKAAGTILGRAQ